LSEAISFAVFVEDQNVIVTELVERAIVERPAHDTIGSILEWLTGGARQGSSFARTIDELSWRLVAAGISVLRVNLRSGTLHPAISRLRLRLGACRRRPGVHDHA
jgi:adenylate cyclase